MQAVLSNRLQLSGPEKDNVKEEALRLSLKYSFVTPLTSMVVTKPTGDITDVLHKPKEGQASQRQDSSMAFYHDPHLGGYAGSIAVSAGVRPTMSGRYGRPLHRRPVQHGHRGPPGPPSFNFGQAAPPMMLPGSSSHKLLNSNPGMISIFFVIVITFFLINFHPL